MQYIRCTQKLLNEGFSQPQIERVLGEYQTIVFGKTNNRSVLGSMTDLSFQKAGLIEKMAKDAKITKVAAGVFLDSFMGNVTKALKKRNGKVILVGFGTFRKVYRKTRKGRNPQIGRAIKIKGRNVVKLKAGKGLQAKI